MLASPDPAEIRWTSVRLQWFKGMPHGRCQGKMAGMELGRTIYDEGWDLFGYTGYSPLVNGIVVSFKGTDSHSLYNWAENMHYWKTEYQVPYPGSEGASVHTGISSTAQS